MIWIKKLYKKLCMFLVNHIFVGAGHFAVKRKLLIAIGYRIGNNTKIVGPVFCTGELEIGANCWIGRNFTINGNGKVIISDNCDIAPDVTFYTGGHEIGNCDRRAGIGKNDSAYVGKGTWVCARSSIVGGVKIGSGCVVASCACVVKDVAACQMVGGVPAKTIKVLSQKGEADNESK